MAGLGREWRIPRHTEHSIVWGVVNAFRKPGKKPQKRGHCMSKLPGFSGARRASTWDVRPTADGRIYEHGAGQRGVRDLAH